MKTNNMHLMKKEEIFALLGGLTFMFGLGLSMGNVNGYILFMCLGGVIAFFGEPIVKRVGRLLKEIANAVSCD